MPWSNQSQARHVVRYAVGLSVASALLLVASIFIVVELVDTLMVR